MQIGDEIINVLEYLGEKVGMTIDWTSDNVLPYLEQLCARFIKWEAGTSIAWIVIAVLISLVFLIIAKISDWAEEMVFTLCCVMIIGFIIIACQTFDIIECYTFPEKAIYDYLRSNGYL